MLARHSVVATEPALGMVARAEQGMETGTAPVIEERPKRRTMVCLNAIPDSSHQHRRTDALGKEDCSC